MQNTVEQVMAKLWEVRELLETGGLRCDGMLLAVDAECSDAYNEIMGAYNTLIDAIDYYADKE